MAYVQVGVEEDMLLRSVLEVVLARPASNPAAIMHELQDKMDGRLFAEVQRDLPGFDESLDFALEFDGARMHIKEKFIQRGHASLLDTIKQKSLSELTEQERQMLRSIGGRGKITQ